MDLAIDKQKSLAKKLAPIFARYREIDKQFNKELNIDEVKALDIELADKFIEVIGVCRKFGFPKSKGRTYLNVCVEIKQNVQKANGEKDLNKYTNYLLGQFEALAKNIGI